MGLDRRQFTALTLAATLATPAAHAQTRTPLVIARGTGNSDWPEGTRGAYDLGITQGADFIEASLVATQDGELVVRRDNELSTSTDVAIRPEFAGRRTSKTINGATVEGWLSETFTLAELKTLTCGAHATTAKRKAAGPSILTFKEVIDIARAGSVRSARVIGVCARLVRPSYFASVGLPLEPRLADVIRANGYDSPAAAMFVQSFEPGALKAIGVLCRTRRVQLVDSQGGPPDMISPDGLKTIRTYAEGIGPNAAIVLDLTARAAAPGALVDFAHGAGLAVQAWTAVGAEALPPPPFRRGDARGYLEAVFAAGVDGFSIDGVALAVRARADALSQLRRQTQKPS